MEDDEYSPNTVCVEFPVHEPYFQKGKRSVSMWEQLEMAAQYQHYWADNSVSITVTFKPEEEAEEGFGWVVGESKVGDQIAGD